VNARTSSYAGSFNSYLSYDGSLVTASAYNATINLAYDTTFGGNNHLTCTWMDTNYNWNNPTFIGRSGESLNLAVNTVADVLHTLYQEAGPAATSTATASPTPSPTPTASASLTPTMFTQSPSATSITPEFPTIQILTVTMLIALAVAIAYKKNH
jgi:hypothetical protein